MIALRSGEGPPNQPNEVSGAPAAFHHSTSAWQVRPKPKIAPAARQQHDFRVRRASGADRRDSGTPIGVQAFCPTCLPTAQVTSVVHATGRCGGHAEEVPRAPGSRSVPKVTTRTEACATWRNMRPEFLRTRGRAILGRDPEHALEEKRGVRNGMQPAGTTVTGPDWANGCPCTLVMLSCCQPRSGVPPRPA